MKKDERALLLDLRPDAKIADGKIRLKIVDESGQPVAGAVVGIRAGGEDYRRKPKMTPYLLSGGKQKQTCKSGTVLLQDKDLFWKGWRKGSLQSLVVMHEGRRIGALASFCPHDKGRSGILTLRPLCRVTGKLTSTKLTRLGKKLFWTDTTVCVGDLMPISYPGCVRRYDILLPPGKYLLRCRGNDTFSARKHITISAGQKELDIDLDLPADRLSYLYGKPAPELRKMVAWKNGDAVSLKQLRGKVVILDFWGWGCGPCVTSMPNLMALHDRYHDKGLEIIAIHYDGVKSMRELGQRCRRIKKELWGGRSLPFHVAIDGGETRIPGFPKRYVLPGATVATYGINMFPTSLVIDKDGILLRKFHVQASLDYLTKDIEKVLRR